MSIGEFFGAIAFYVVIMAGLAAWALVVKAAYVGFLYLWNLI